jgi:hypothetical protein
MSRARYLVLFLALVFVVLSFVLPASPVHAAQPAIAAPPITDEQYLQVMETCNGLMKEKFPNSVQFTPEWTGQIAVCMIYMGFQLGWAEGVHLKRM